MALLNRVYVGSRLSVPTTECNDGNHDIIIAVGRISIESILWQVLFIETDDRQPNSEGDERHQHGINSPQH
jgi:hypothetical protein